MSKELTLLDWHPEGGSRGFSPFSPPPPSPSPPSLSLRRSLEDRRSQRASAACRT